MGIKSKTLLGALLLANSVVWATPAAAAAPAGTDKYELSSFIVNFTHLKPDDKVPPLYLTEEYTIKQWNLRSLPASTAGTHWTHIGGAYVLVNDADAKIIRACDSKIFYHR